MIPLVGGLSTDPIVPNIASWMVIACLATITLFAHRDHVRTGTIFLAMLLMTALVLLNQHRLQPWVVHLVILICVLSTGPRHSNGLRTIRLVTIGIYFHSAVSKLDYDFLSGGGFYLVEAVGSLLQMPINEWPPSARVGATIMLPLFELSVAAALVSRRFRNHGWVMAIMMHTGLLAALYGLHHKPGVLIWNACFIVQAMVFLTAVDTTPKTSDSNPLPVGARLVSFVAIVTAIVLPFLNYEPIQLWDNWPSWSLYSTRSERVRVFIHEDFKSGLPKSLQQYVGPPSPFLCRVKVDRWSLDETGAPVYPEDRFGAGVALHLASQMDTGRGGNRAVVHVFIDSAAHRLSGERVTTELVGLSQVKLFADGFWLNATPVK